MKNALAFLCLSLALVACGKEPGVSSGDCNNNVISAYNSMAITCGNLNEYNYKRCRSELRSFLDQYPTVDCSAERLSTGGNMPIRQSELRNLLTKLDQIN